MRERERRKNGQVDMKKVYYCSIVLFTTSFTVSISQQHIPPHGNLTSWGSSYKYLGTRKAADGISDRRTQMCMYASTKSTLLMKAGPGTGLASRRQSIRWYGTLTNRITSLGPVCTTFLLNSHQGIYCL